MQVASLLLFCFVFSSLFNFPVFHFDIFDACMQVENWSNNSPKCNILDRETENESVYIFEQQLF